MRRPRLGQGGESLLELIVSVSILGLGVVALLGGLATAALSSGLHRSQSDVSAVLTATAEHVKAAPYKKCAVKVDYLGGFVYPDHTVTPTATGLTVATSGGVQKWVITFSISDSNGTGFARRDLAASPADTATCEAADAQKRRIQVVGLAAATSDGKITQSLPIVKRFRDCLAATTSTSTPGCD